MDRQKEKFDLLDTPAPYDGAYSVPCHAVRGRRSVTVLLTKARPNGWTRLEAHMLQGFACWPAGGTSRRPEHGASPLPL